MISDEIRHALNASPELVADMWIREQGFAPRATQAPLGYARSNALRESMIHGTSPVPIDDALAYLSDHDADPLNLLISSEESEEESAWASPAPVEAPNTRERARRGRRTQRRVQQLDAARRKALEGGQMSFAGFGWGTAA